MKVIEFLGMSRAGKTTQQRIISEVLQKSGYSCALFTRPDLTFRQVGSLEKFHMLFFECMKKAYMETEGKVDYLLFDRGFYDRLGMLTKDVSAGRVTKSFGTELEIELAEYASRTRHPMLFMLSPATSYSRWGQQIIDGLDSNLLSGLEEETVEVLQKEKDIYLDLRARYPHIPLLDAEVPKEILTSKLLGLLEMTSNINDGVERTLCMK